MAQDKEKDEAASRAFRIRLEAMIGERQGHTSHGPRACCSPRSMRYNAWESRYGGAGDRQA